MRLVEPCTGKVLWSERNNINFATTHGFVVADGRAFVPYNPGPPCLRAANARYLSGAV